MKMPLLVATVLALALPAAAGADPVVVDGDAGGDSSTSLNPDPGAFVGVGLIPAGGKPGSVGTLFSKDGFLISFQITDGTDFAYEPVSDFADFDPVTGTTLEHSESQAFPGTNPRIGFNVGTDNERNIGDFDIGFDETRTQGSGFFLEDVTGDFQIPLFDFAAPTEFTATATNLVVQSELLFSPEFSQLLQDEGFTSTDTTGTSAGLARIDAVIPEPSTLVLLTTGLLGLSLRRRRA